jgi:hypothetical protein
MMCMCAQNACAHKDASTLTHGTYMANSRKAITHTAVIIIFSLKKTPMMPGACTCLIRCTQIHDTRAATLRSNVSIMVVWLKRDRRAFPYCAHTLLK